MENSKSILKERLAKGDISVDEYRNLLSIIYEDNAEESKSELIDQPNQLKTNRLIYEFEDIQIFEDKIIFKNKEFSIKDIVTVFGKFSDSYFNFVPMSRSSLFAVGFLSGEPINLYEHRDFLGWKRHKAIRHIYDILRKITFNQRLTNLAKKLKQQGEVQLTKTWVFEGKEHGQTVILMKDGNIIVNNKRVNIKTAKASGTFSIGTEWRSINGMNRHSTPNEVVLSEKKGLLKSLIPTDAIRFVPTCEDIDITLSLLEWISEPENNL
jgi:hypothetical protein